MKISRTSPYKYLLSVLAMQASLGISNLFEFNGYLYDGVEGNEERHRQQMTLSFGYPLYPWYPAPPHYAIHIMQVK